MPLKLTSDDFQDGERLPLAHVFNGMGHKGDNRAPSLSWSGAPAGTKSFVLTCYDPDAPSGSGWWHWVVVNIPPSATGLEVDADGKMVLPEGALETRTDWGHPGYNGAAPPPGPAHRYIFTLHALGTEQLYVDADTSAAHIGVECHFAAIETATLTAIYP